MSSNFSSPFMAKSPLNENHLNKAEERLIGLRDKMKDTEEKADESYKESGDSKKTKKLDKKRDRQQTRLNRKLKRKEAKGKVDKQKMIDEVMSRKEK
tara:strand:- start:194 stop:484 length:291 start_codon:yes stop_codon:yes gene_type:complete